MIAIEDLLKIIEKAKEFNILSFKYQGLEIQYFAYPPALIPKPHVSMPTPVPEARAEELVKPLSALDQMTDQEILYYASPYYDELQAQKEAHAKKLAEEAV